MYAIDPNPSLDSTWPLYNLTNHKRGVTCNQKNKTLELSSKKCKLQMILEYVDNNGWMRFNIIIFLGPCKVLNMGISSRNCGWLMIVTEYDGLPC